jgi:hypothetical protein
MTVTTEEAERLAQTHDLVRFTFGMKAPEHDLTSAYLRSLAAERDALRRERDGANALVERMHEQDVLAIKAWQAAHPGSELTWPSNARLSAWCMGEVASVTAERDALRAENARLRDALRLAIDAVQFWAAYATPYFQDKHDLEEDLRKLRAALGETQ